MSEDQLKALQEELAALRSRTKRRSFKQVLKDADTKFFNIINKEPESFEEFVIQASLAIIGFLIATSLILLIVATIIYTKGLIFLLLPAYVLYYLVKKDTNGSDS